MAKKASSAVPPALAKAYAKVEAKLDGKFVWGLPNYTHDSKYKMSLVELGDLNEFEANDVDMDEIGPWLPLAVLGQEPQFLCVSTKPPFAVGMWEHETGEVEEVWESLEALAAIALAKKSDKTPIELLEKDLEKASKLVDADKKPAALKLLEPIMKTLPKLAEDEEDENQARAWNLYGMALEDAKRLPAAKAAYERAIAAGDDYALLNLLDMFENAEDPKSLIASALPLRKRGVWDPYVKIWLARYLAVGYAALGKKKEAQAELTKSVEEFGVKESDKLAKARASLVEYIGKNKPGAKLLATWIDAYKPTAYEVATGDAKANRAWWNKLQPDLQKRLLKTINKEGEPSDADIARTKDVDALNLRESEGSYDDVRVFLDFPKLERLGFYGDPESIEALRKFKDLDLTINNDVIKNFEWPSRADRDYLAAAKKGDKKGVEKALKAGADLHARGDFGSNAVDLCSFDHPALAKWLVEKGVDPWAGTHGDMIEVGNADDRFTAAAKKAGIPHPDLDVWRQLRAGHEKDGATFEWNTDLELEDGESLVGKFPKTVKLKMEPPKKDGKLYDLHRVKYRGLVASERLAKVLEGPNVEIFPVTLVDHAGKARPEKYFFINPLAIDCLITAKCYPQWNHISKNSLSAVGAYAIDAKKVGKAKMFRLGVLNDHPVIIPTAFAAQLTPFTGIRLEYIRR